MRTVTCTECAAAISAGIVFWGLRGSLCHECWQGYELDPGKAYREDAERRVRECEEALEEARLDLRDAERSLAEAQERLEALKSQRPGGQP